MVELSSRQLVWAKQDDVFVYTFAFYPIQLDLKYEKRIEIFSENTNTRKTFRGGGGSKVSNFIKEAKDIMIQKWKWPSNKEVYYWYNHEDDPTNHLLIIKDDFK